MYVLSNVCLCKLQYTFRSVFANQHLKLMTRLEAISHERRFRKKI